MTAPSRPHRRHLHKTWDGSNLSVRGNLARDLTNQVDLYLSCISSLIHLTEQTGARQMNKSIRQSVRNNFLRFSERRAPIAAHCAPPIGAVSLLRRQGKIQMNTTAPQSNQQRTRMQSSTTDLSYKKSISFWKKNWINRREINWSLIHLMIQRLLKFNTFDRIESVSIGYTSIDSPWKALQLFP